MLNFWPFKKRKPERVFAAMYNDGRYFLPDAVAGKYQVVKVIFAEPVTIAEIYEQFDADCPVKHDIKVAAIYVGDPAE